MRDITTTLSYQWFERVWNQNDPSAIDELMHTNVKAHGLGGNKDFIDGADFKQFYRDFTNQYTNIHVVVVDVIAQDDMETALCHVTVTQRESGKTANFHGQCMARFEDGKIMEAWNSYDFLGMYLQLGYELKAE